MERRSPIVCAIACLQALRFVQNFEQRMYNLPEGKARECLKESFYNKNLAEALKEDAHRYIEG